MGGDMVPVLNSSAEEESSLDQEYEEHPHGISNFFDEEALSAKVENGSVFGEFDDLGRRISSNSVVFEANHRRMQRVYAEVLRSYDDLQHRSEHLEEAKRKILSYTPGSWIEKVSGTKVSDYDVPKTTLLLLIGPKGSGKSSLVNKVSRVFEDDIFASERAQVSYNPSVGDGTYFVREYMIPRGSGAFCLYDTRSLSEESAENMKMLEHWMTKGVRHGELVLRDSDSRSMETRMKFKARFCNCYAREARMVNCVIFVVNGLSVLEALDSDDKTEKPYTEMIVTTFNSPFLSFKDDRPVIVVTHGDLLSISDRVRVRVHLGELLGIPPHKQIFDIPESDDRAVELTILDMIRYCLEHADINLPVRGWFARKRPAASPLVYFFMLMLGIAIFSAYVFDRTLTHHSPPLCTSVEESGPLQPSTAELNGLQEYSFEPSHSSIPDSPLCTSIEDSCGSSCSSNDWQEDSFESSYFSMPEWYDWHAIRHLWLG